MCGRVFVRTSLSEILAAFATAQSGGDVEGMSNTFPRWNGAPKQDYPIIIREPDVAGPVFMRANWGLIPRRTADPKKLPLMINARAETITTNGYFKFPYRSQRALMPIHGFFEWWDQHGHGKDKQPYAIAMADDSLFCLAALWETWRNPTTGELQRTFAVLTCAPNELMATVHDRMPVILHPADYARWLSAEEDPRDLLQPFPAEKMKMWPVSPKVGNYRNDMPDVLDMIELDKGPG